MTTHPDDPRITFHDVEQRSDEWHALRRGILTASTIGRLITRTPVPLTEYPCRDCGAEPYNPCVSKAKTKGEPAPIKTTHRSRESIAAEVGATTLTVADNDIARGLIATLAGERITGHVEDGPFTRDMERGVMAEPFAEDAYVERTGNTVEHVGFIVRHFDGFALGMSPDGLVGDDGLTEWKAPRARGHISTVLADEVPAHHVAQCQTALLVTGRKWIDFVSFHGGLPLYIKRVHPDPQWFAAIEAAARAAEAAIVDITERYESATAGLPATDRMPDPYAEMVV